MRWRVLEKAQPRLVASSIFLTLTLLPLLLVLQIERDLVLYLRDGIIENNASVCLAAFRKTKFLSSSDHSSHSTNRHNRATGRATRDRHKHLSFFTKERSMQQRLQTKGPCSSTMNDTKDTNISTGHRWMTRMVLSRLRRRQDKNNNTKDAKRERAATLPFDEE